MARLPDPVTQISKFWNWFHWGSDVNHSPRLTMSVTGGADCLSLHGRVLRKHPYSKNLLFLDVVHCSVDDDDSATPGQCAIASVAVRRDESSPALHLVVGDVIFIEHGWVRNFEEAVVCRSQRLSLVVQPSQVSVVQPWALDSHGFFSFESAKLLVQPFGTESRLVFPAPRLAIQCKQQAVDRVLSALAQLCQRLFPHAKPTLRESSTGFIKSSDRLVLLLEAQEEEDKVQVSQRELVRLFVEDAVVSPAIMRIYSASCKEALAQASHPLLSQAMADLQRQLKKIVEEQEEEKGSLRDIRLHIYPKHIAQEVIDLAEDWLTDLWNPRQTSHVLNAFLTDGVWHLAVLPREDVFIGDLRDKKAVPNFGRPSSSSSSPRDSSSQGELRVERGDYDAICRATNKLREIFSRNHSLWMKALDCEKKVFQLAVDVGASPGGWTSYLSQQIACDLVISVDKGDLSLPAPWPAQVQHWRVLGQQALAVLASLKAGESLSAEALPPGLDQRSLQTLASRRIDLFCCDANIAPGISFDMLWQAEAAGLLDERGCLVIITCKNVFGKKDPWDKAVRDCMEALQSRQEFRSVQLQHLLANTAKEITISAVYTTHSQQS
eukprot:gene11660-13075_t